jgi:hypothetical protein
MNRSRVFSAALIVAAAAWSLVPAPSRAQEPSNFTIVAKGLEGPRGLKFGPDGALYIAEAGTGGTTSTVGKCTQVVPPVGPYKGGSSGRISKLQLGKLSTVASGFPSTEDAMGDLIGVADVAFVGPTLYALVAGGGCSHGHTGLASGIAKVSLGNGFWTLIADVGSWLKTHPTRYESPDDFEPDGTLYSLISLNGVLYTIEPNHGQLISVTPNGVISQVIDISASEGHIVPTSVAARFGNFYVGNLNLFPIDPQWARVLTISPTTDDNPAPGFSLGTGWHIVNSKAGFTTVVAVTFGPDGLLYALELSDLAGFPAPGTGKVVRVLSNGNLEEVITGLNVPTGMTFGPDGALYISDFGAAPAPAIGVGRILRFVISAGS